MTPGWSFRLLAPWNAGASLQQNGFEMTDADRQGNESTTLWKRSGGHLGPDQSGNQDLNPGLVFVEVSTMWLMLVEVWCLRVRFSCGYIGTGLPLFLENLETWKFCQGILKWSQKCQGKCNKPGRSQGISSVCRKWYLMWYHWTLVKWIYIAPSRETSKALGYGSHSVTCNYNRNHFI